jgi:hypothetical protein
MKVYLAAVTHKHGRNLYAGADHAELISKLAGYVRDQGGPEEWPGSYKPENQAEIDAMTDLELVERYFEDHPSEYVEEESDEIAEQIWFLTPGSGNIPTKTPDFDDSYRPAGTAIEGRSH